MSTRNSIQEEEGTHILSYRSKDAGFQLRIDAGYYDPGA